MTRRATMGFTRLVMRSSERSLTTGSEGLARGSTCLAAGSTVSQRDQPCQNGIDRVATGSASIATGCTYQRCHCHYRFLFFDTAGGHTKCVHRPRRHGIVPVDLLRPRPAVDIAGANTYKDPIAFYRDLFAFLGPFVFYRDPIAFKYI
jgi:hypothetical protein